MSKGKNQSTQPIIEKRELIFHFYYPASIKKEYTRIYDVLSENHSRTYKAMYERLITQTNKVAEELKEEAEAKLSPGIYSESFDYGDFMEVVQEYVYERLEEQFLMHYHFELMALGNLYQVFEQQLRKLFYEEMTHNENEGINQVKFIHTDENNKNAFDSFYTKFRNLNNLLRELGFTFTDMFGNEELIVDSDIWNTIRECNRISNTFKHGSGTSAENLFKESPQYFETVSGSGRRTMDLYRTTNLKRVLNVDEISFEKYSNAMKKFWENMKEHQRGKSIQKLIYQPRFNERGFE